MICHIVGAGDFVPIAIEKGEGDLVIAADNGLSHLLEIGVLPDLVIGDFDSLSEDKKDFLDAWERENPGSVIRLPRQKDDTDTLYCIREGFRRGYKNFRLYAALGGARFDHTVANLQTLLFIKNRGGEAYILDEKTLIGIVRNETRTFHRGFSGGFSLFALDPEVRHVTIRGMEYNIEDAVLTNDFPLGVSNRIPGDTEASVTVGEGACLMVVSFDQEP